MEMGTLSVIDYGAAVSVDRVSSERSRFTPPLLTSALYQGSPGVRSPCSRNRVLRVISELGRGTWVDLAREARGKVHWLVEYA